MLVVETLNVDVDVDLCEHVAAAGFRKRLASDTAERKTRITETFRKRFRFLGAVMCQIKVLSESRGCQDAPRFQTCRFKAHQKTGMKTSKKSKQTNKKDSNFMHITLGVSLVLLSEISSGEVSRMSSS